MANFDFPEWVRPGARVVIRPVGSSDGVRTSTIKRVGKRDVVTEDGSRFQFDGAAHMYSWVGSGSWRRPGAELVSFSDPQGQLSVAQARGRIARRKMLKVLQGGDSDAAAVEQVTALLAQLAAAAHDQLILESGRNKEEG